jgi:hypothetical protein
MLGYYKMRDFVLYARRLKIWEARMGYECSSSEKTNECIQNTDKKTSSKMAIRAYNITKNFRKADCEDGR